MCSEQQKSTSMHIKFTFYNITEYHSSCIIDRERSAYAHTVLQLFTDEEFESEREWIAGFAEEDDAAQVIRAARDIWISSFGKYVEIYISFSNVMSMETNVHYFVKSWFIDDDVDNSTMDVDAVYLDREAGRQRRSYSSVNNVDSIK